MSLFGRFQLPQLRNFLPFGKKKRRSSHSPSDQANLSETVDRSSHVSTYKPQDGYKRPPLEKIYPYLLAFLLGYWLADLGTLGLRDKFVAKSVVDIPLQRRPLLTKRPLRTEYNVITDRNIFNADGIIPPPLSSESAPQQEDLSNPVPSQLPLKLIGTIVHVNPTRSVATVQVQGKGIFPYIPDDDMESIAKLIKVERLTAILRNNQNGRLEYIEIKDQVITLSTQTPSSKQSPGSKIQQQGNTFSLRRSDVNRYMQNLPTLLQQARAVPNIEPGSGAVNGFRLVDIQPGSLYERLGLRRNDIIKAVNGKSINSPARAMQLYNSLKTESNIAIDIGRNGKAETLNFSITE